MVVIKQAAAKLSPNEFSMRLVLATKNPGKLKEMLALASLCSDHLNRLNLELAPDQFDPEETGSTFAENALIKAKAAAGLTGTHALADDSGIAVDILAGRPGVYSARYAEGDEVKGCQKLLTELKNIPPEKRTAAYHCVMAQFRPKENYYVRLREYGKEGLLIKCMAMAASAMIPFFI